MIPVLTDGLCHILRRNRNLDVHQFNFLFTGDELCLVLTGSRLVVFCGDGRFIFYFQMFFRVAYEDTWGEPKVSMSWMMASPMRLPKYDSVLRPSSVMEKKVRFMEASVLMSSAS